MSIELQAHTTGCGLGEVLPVQCASCPFKDGNDEEWAAVVNKLRVKHGLRPVKVKSRIVKHARTAVRIETGMIGTPQFACHGTAYDDKANLRPYSEHRQCPGAVEFIKKLNGGKE